MSDNGNVLHFKVPGKSEPGYLERVLRASEFQQLLHDDEHPFDAAKAYVEFLMEFVDQPRDKNKARNLLLSASEEQIDELLKLIQGRETKKEISPLSLPASTTGETEKP